MAIGEICNREVVVVTRETPVVEAAQLMRHHHVGDVVVVLEEAGLRTPVGILTDRDIVVEVVAAGLDPAGLKVGDIMAPDLATVREDTGVFEAIRYMRDKGCGACPWWMRTAISSASSRSTTCSICWPRNSTPWPASSPANRTGKRGSGHEMKCRRAWGGNARRIFSFPILDFQLPQGAES